MTRPARSVKERNEEGSDAENNVTDVDAAKQKQPRELGSRDKEPKVKCEGHHSAIRGSRGKRMTDSMVIVIEVVDEQGRAL